MFDVFCLWWFFLPAELNKTKMGNITSGHDRVELSGTLFNLIGLEGRFSLAVPVFKILQPDEATGGARKRCHVLAVLEGTTGSASQEATRASWRCY